MFFAIASHTSVSAPCSGVRSLPCILRWKSGIEDLTAVKRNIRYMYDTSRTLSIQEKLEEITWSVCPSGMHRTEVDVWMHLGVLLRHDHLLSFVLCVRKRSIERLHVRQSKVLPIQLLNEHASRTHDDLHIQYTGTFTHTLAKTISINASHHSRFRKSLTL